MPNTTVRANARAVSEAKLRSPAAPAFDLSLARAKWESACAASDAASARYTALCGEMEFRSPRCNR